MVQGKGGVRPSGVIVSCGDKEISFTYTQSSRTTPARKTKMKTL